MNETEKSLLVAAIVVLLKRAGGQMRITQAEYEDATGSAISRKMDGSDVILAIVKAGPRHK